MLAEPSFRMAHVGRRKHVHTLQSRNAAKPFRLAAQFSQRRCGNWSCRGGSQSLRTASRLGGQPGRRRSTSGQRQAVPALCDSRRVGDVDGLSECRRLRPGRCLGRGQYHPRRRAAYRGGHRRRDRCHRAHRDARLHRYASPPVRDGAAQLSRRRRPHQRRLRHAERQHDLLRLHPEQIRPGVSDAAIQALIDTGRRAAFGYFESAGNFGAGVPGNQYPQDAPRILKQWFSPGNLSRNGLVHMIMGGEVYLGTPTTDKSWTIGRNLGLQIAAHILSPFGIRPILDSLAAGTGGNGHIGIGPDNLFIHMTGMSDMGWQAVKDKGAQVSIAFPIEMNMRHGMPPILKAQSLGMEPSLSVDVECTLTADFSTQMRSCMNLQRALVNQMILDQNTPPDTLELALSNNWGLPPSAAANPWPKPPASLPAPLTTRDVLRFATMNGAKALRLDSKVGSLTPGKEADIIILDATRLNVAPLNQVPGAVVSLMDRTNVETVIVAGKVRKWKGQLLDVDLDRLRAQLTASRDYVFSAAGIPQNLFSSQ